METLFKQISSTSAKIAAKFETYCKLFAFLFLKMSNCLATCCGDVAFGEVQKDVNMIDLVKSAKIGVDPAQNVSSKSFHGTGLAPKYIDFLYSCGMLNVT